MPVKVSTLQSLGFVIAFEARERCVTKYMIVPHRPEEGYSVWIPGLPGRCSQGETEAEAIANIKFAAQEYLVVLEELGNG